jgi:pre-mRNA-splicing factor ISY1
MVCVRALNYAIYLCSTFFQARNEEKAQSMLYRFREAQAAELGLGTRADRRPRMASACKSLRDCERWRGEILREISRKVSKIQDGT